MITDIIEMHRTFKIGSRNSANYAVDTDPAMLVIPEGTPGWVVLSFTLDATQMSIVEFKDTLLDIKAKYNVTIVDNYLVNPLAYWHEGQHFIVILVVDENRRVMTTFSKQELSTWVRVV